MTNEATITVFPLKTCLGASLPDASCEYLAPARESGADDGRRQTNLQQVDDAGTSFVFQIDRANEVNHLTVFLLGTGTFARALLDEKEKLIPDCAILVPFPEGYGASVHFQFPGKPFVPLGT